MSFRGKYVVRYDADIGSRLRKFDTQSAALRCAEVVTSSGLAFPPEASVTGYNINGDPVYRVLMVEGKIESEKTGLPDGWND